MSRAFVKESDEDLAAAELPERSLSDQPNYVTPRGIKLLRERFAQLQQERDQLAAADEPLAKQKLLEVKRDLRYFTAQVERAVVGRSRRQPHDEVRFGASVEISDEGRASAIRFTSSATMKPTWRRAVSVGPRRSRKR
jgi:transcription elongation GreA/GreB family factor